jgi:hypothetical protein
LDNGLSVMDCGVTSEMGRRRPSRHWELERNTEKERLAGLVAEKLHAGRLDQLIRSTLLLMGLINSIDRRIFLLFLRVMKLERSTRKG